LDAAAREFAQAGAAVEAPLSDSDADAPPAAETSVEEEMPLTGAPRRRRRRRREGTSA
jgi:hypothetical protein